MGRASGRGKPWPYTRRVRKLENPGPMRITFEFNRKRFEAAPNDTVASALYRAGMRVFSRSFKYHRPRGLLCLAGKCPNCLVNVDGQPNVRACMMPVRQGMRVRHQNAYPSLEHDVLSVVQHLDWLMPVGWYYKGLSHPKAWHAAEPFIRKVAGLGDPPAAGLPGPEYEHAYMHVEVAVIGGGPAGLHAALEFGRAGGQVLLIDDQSALGGHLRYQKNPSARLADLIANLQALGSVKVMQGCSCFGLYEGNLLGVLQPSPHPMVVERLVHVRAQRIVVATGAYETPLLFPNNDLVGVMLSSAVERLIRLHGIVPGSRAVIVADGKRGEEVANDLREAGEAVVATVAADAVVEAVGGKCVKGLHTREGNFKCDLVVVCGHRVPDVGLLAQAGARLDWDADRGAFVPLDLPPHVQAVGEVTGGSLVAAPVTPSKPSFNKRAFICLCSDVTSQDLRDAISEGFDHIEPLKRYTTATMGPCQGKMCQLNAVAICAHEKQRSMAATGMTTARPPNPSVTLGALAGPRHHPIRRTPLHCAHEELGAVWMDMGDWKRPRFYRTAASSMERRCVDEEYRAVRERVGLIDVGTLGKLDLQGRDCGVLLDWVYSNRPSDLRPGRVRYSVLCDEAGIMLDDGTISRIADDRYFITTTTGNLDFVQQWLEWWLIGTGWDVHLTNVTGLAAVNLAGPQARSVLRKLTNCDLSREGFPYMSCRQAEVAGVPLLMLRIGFVGETGWEMHFPGEWGEYLWKKLLEAGKEFEIRPFGVEAQRLLRLEKRHVIVGVDTDALTNPLEADMGWVAKMDKADFIGRAALLRLGARQPQQKLVGFMMQGDSVPEDGAAILVRGRLAGRVTSARYSPVNDKAVGLAWLAAEVEKAHNEIQVRVNGRLEAARITRQAFYDPEGARLRM